MIVKNKQNYKHGFSLVEMAVVISVMAIILTTFFSVVSNLNITATKKSNEDQMDAVQNAINSFYLTNGYIPCPAARNATIPSAAFGVSTNCSIAAVAGETVETGTGANVIRIGVLPSRTLGLQDSQGLDAYGNKIGYAVVKSLGVNKTNFDASTATSTAITINDRAANSITSNLVGSDFVSYIAYSYGANGRGAYNNQGIQGIACGSNVDSENCNDDNVFLETLKDPANDDDLLRWQTQHQLQYNASFAHNAFTATNPSPRRLFDKYAMITYEFGNGTADGAPNNQTYNTANSWVSRVWTTVRNNSLTSLALDGVTVPQSTSLANYSSPTQITLGAGTYWIKATASGVRNGYNKLRLYNVTTSSVIEYGAIDSSTPCNLNSTSSSQYNAAPFLVTVVTFATTTTITLDQVFSTTVCGTTFLGEPTYSGGGMHSIIEIWEF